MIEIYSISELSGLGAMQISPDSVEDEMKYTKFVARFFSSKL